jgi:hypothetical protein
MLFSALVGDRAFNPPPKSTAEQPRMPIAILNQADTAQAMFLPSPALSYINLTL